MTELELEAPDAMLTRVAELAETRLDTFADALHRHLLIRLPGTGSVEPDPLATAIRRAAVAVARDVLARLRGHRRAPDQLPPDAELAVQMWAHAGHSPAAALEIQFFAVELFWDSFAECAEVASADPSLRWQLMKMARERTAGYNERLGELFRREHDRHALRGSGVSDMAISRSVRGVLAGETLTDAELGHRLSGAHVAVVATARPVLSSLARRAGRELLAIRSRDGLLWGWLTAETPLTPAALDALVMWQSVQGGEVAFGEPATGIAGFRASHREALEAWRVARLTGESAVRYASVSLIALALKDPSWCRALIARELGPLGGASTPSASRRREILRAYVDLGFNASCAAAAMGCHRNTVKAHVASLEQYRGCAVTSRSASLHLALLLADFELGTSRRASPSVSPEVAPADDPRHALAV